MLPSSDICQAIVIPTSSSVSAFVWQSILFLWPWKFVLILLAILIWTIWEIITRGKHVNFNSVNGFSPGFNSFVGSGLYWGLQALILLLFAKIFGPNIYCLPLPYFLHIFLLVAVAVFLHKIGFWPELRIFHRRKRYFRKSHINNKK